MFIVKIVNSDPPMYLYELERFHVTWTTQKEHAEGFTQEEGEKARQIASILSEIGSFLLELVELPSFGEDDDLEHE
jgi:hypothetical protein